MKTPRFYFLLTLLTSLFVSEAQSQIGSHGQFALFPGAESKMHPHDYFSSPAPVEKRPGYSSSDSTSPPPFGYKNGIQASLSIFYYWLYGWFFTGKYVAYQPHKFIYKYPKHDPKTSDKRISLKKQGRISKNNSKTNKTKRKEKSSGFHQQTSSDAIPEKYQALAASMDTKGITLDELSTQHMPKDFPSGWVWIVIGWIDNALKQVQGQYFTNHSFDDVLANTDPALPAVVRGTLRAALFIEDDDIGEQFFSNRHVALTIGWMDYMFTRYHCPFDWRRWLVSKPDFDKGSLLQSESEDLMTHDWSEAGMKYIARRLRLSESVLNTMTQPRCFRSTSLWLIIEEFNSDQLHCQDASSFSTIFPVDPIFADTVSSVLYEIFSAKSKLNEKELYLMELWLDQAIERLQTDTNTFMTWRDLMSLAPNSPDYFTEHEPMAGIVESPSSSGSLCPNEATTDVLHRGTFTKTTEKNQLLFFQLEELDSDESENNDDEDSDYEIEGEGYLRKSRTK